MSQSLPAFHSHLCFSDPATSADSSIHKPIQLDAVPSYWWEWEGVTGVGSGRVVFWQQLVVMLA